MTDITYIRTWQGWLYLAVVLDLYSRKVIDWSMKPTIAKDIVLDVLLMAIWRRRPNEPVITLRPMLTIQHWRLAEIPSEA